MDYNIEIYKTDEQNLNRFALGSLSEKTLFVFGVNPSTASDTKPDPTIKKVMGFAEKNGYTSFMMFNLYPHRTPHPYKLPNIVDKSIEQQNINTILEIITANKQADILLAWGGAIYAREYLQDCMRTIYEALSANKTKITWLRIGDMLKCHQPRHPLYAPYRYAFQEMNMAEYLK